MSICEQRWGQKDAFLQRSHIIKELRRSHGSELDSLRDSLKMLDVLASNRDLQDAVKENAEMFVDVEKLGLYQLVKEKGEAKGIERGIEQGHREIVLRLLHKLSPEQVADLSGVPLAKVNAIAAANA